MSVEERTSTVTVRRVRERHVPVAWWPGALLPLALLAATLLYALWWLPGLIQAEVRRDSEATLSAEGYHWASVDVDGRDVVLRGVPPSQREGEDATAALRDLTTVTWAGRLVSPRTVRGDFAASAVTPPPAAAAEVAAGWVFRRQPASIRLSGTVADESARSEIVEAAREMADRSGVDDVIDELTIGAAGPHGAGALGVFGISVLEACITGRVDLDSGAIGVACEVERPAEASAVRQRLERRPEAMQLGDVDVLVREQADACDDAMASLLEQPIRFATSEATVQRRSFDLLDDIAEASAACPGQLRIEGHTDSSGTAAFNERLSAARADAVKGALVERGVSADRLTTVGVGPARPIASNSTARGRSANRRIEISVVRPNDL